MKLTSKLTSFFVVSGLCLIGAVPSHAAQLQYNLSFEVTNSTTGADLFTDASFFVDPTLATTSHGADGIGETYSTPVSSLAMTVFDFGTAQSVGTVSYSLSNLQNAGLVYFSSFNPSTGIADPIFTLSAPDATGFLTLVMNGSSDSFYQSSTLGGTSGSPLASGTAQMATNLDVSPVPEPRSLTLLIAAGLCFLAVFGLRRRQSQVLTSAI